MTKVVLPKLNQVGANEWADVQDDVVAIREVVNGELDHENLKTAAGITGGQLAEEVLKLAVKGTKRAVSFGEAHLNYPSSAVSTILEVEHGLAVEPKFIGVVGVTDIGARTSDYTIMARSKTKFSLRGVVSSAFGESIDTYFLWVAIG